MEDAVFPVVAGESRLPVYLVGVGRMRRQDHILRPAGFPVGQVLLCAGGAGRLLLEGREHRVAAGQGFLLYPGVPHEYYPLEEPWETHWVSFACPQASGLLPAMGFAASRMFWLRDPLAQEAQWQALFAQAASDSLERGYRCSALVYQFLVSLRGNLAAEPPSQGEGRGPLSAAVAFINLHFDRPLGLEEIAGQAGISPQYLCRLFRRGLNMRPFEYLARRRIQQAKQQLLEDGATVAGVARRCGFGSVSYFCAVFRRYEKLTPQQFRSLHRQTCPPAA